MIATGRPTLYELAITKGDQRFLIMYCGRQGRSTIWDCCQEHGLKLVALTGCENLTFAKLTRDGAMMGDWQIRFTGRTQRDAHSTNQLPWIGDLA